MKVLLIILLGLTRTSQALAGSGHFKGESCARCHAAIRDKAPGPAGGRVRDAGNFDAVVIGGGLSGLSAGYFLRSRNILVLEAESKPGGRARMESFSGTDRFWSYSVGMVYIGEPQGEIGTMFKDLGLSPKLITMPEHSLFSGGKIVPHWLTKDGSNLPDPPYGPADREKFGKLQKFFADMTAGHKLAVPIENAEPAVLAEYDKESYWDFLEREYGRVVAEIGDAYCRDVFGDGARSVSAYAGILYQASERDTSYTFEGGMGDLPDALHKRLGRRVRTGAFVWNVREIPDGVEVDFTRHGKDYRARAKVAVMAVSSLIARRIAPGLSDEKRQALSQVRYSSYVLVPMRLKRTIWADSFVLWNPKAFFMDLTLPRADNEPLKRTPGRGQVLVAYAPLGAEGRPFVLKATDAEIISRTFKDFDLMFPGASQQVREARVVRWGHAMPLPYAGYLTKVRPRVARPEGRILFAGVDTQVPAMEGAISSALIASRQAEALLDQGPAGP